MIHSAAIAQNNLAVAHLRANNIQLSRLFCTAALEHQLALERGGVNPPPQKSAGDGKRICIDECMLLSDSQDERGAEAATPFIFKAGISIPDNEALDSRIITPILIFNTALAHQLLAEQDCYNPHKHLLKAKSLYELAYKSIRPDTNSMFEFVILNNTAMIHRQIGDESTAGQYFDYLLTAWMLFVDRGCSLQLRCLGRFLRNLASAAVAAAA